MTDVDSRRRPEAAPFAIWLVLAGLLVFAVYHLIRDASTTFFQADSTLVAVAHRPHEWCKPICDYVTMPLELVNIITIPPVLVWRRPVTPGRVAVLAWLNLLSIPLWLLAWLLP